MIFSILMLLAVSPMFPGQFPSIEVNEEISLVDQETIIVVKNLKPKEIISVRAEAIDDANSRWFSSASFQTSEKGFVDLSQQSPLEGSYTGIDSMGLLWSMESEEGPHATFTTKNEQFAINLRVFRANQEITSKKIIRLLKSPEVEKREVRENGLVATLFLPSSDKPLPVIITLCGSNGGIGVGKSQLLASHGFAVFALGYFGLEGLPSILKNIPLEYFETAFSSIKSQPDLDGSHIGIYGGSRGGELALILGSRFPESVQAIVAAVPSSVIYGGGEFSLIQHNSPVAAWIYRGKPIAPFAPEVLPDFSEIKNDADHPFFETPCFLEGMKNKEAFNAAFIPVEKIKADLLFISGGDDQMWPSGVYANQIEERLSNQQSTIHWEHLHYPEAGHGITMPYLPESSLVYYHPIAKMWFSLGGTRAENHYACQDSWKKLITFFKKSLLTQT